MAGTCRALSALVVVFAAATLGGCKGGGASPAPAPERCIVETPDSPPPAATPAEFCPPPPLPDVAFGDGRVAFSTPGVFPIDVEVARTEEERNRGLMYRDSMPEDQGMVFVWPEDGRRSFWMRNTCLPLDMLFIAMDGTIVGILEQVPTMNDVSRFVPCPAAFVLEVNAGWSREHGVKAGDRVQIAL